MIVSGSAIELGWLPVNLTANWVSWVGWLDWVIRISKLASLPEMNSHDWSTPVITTWSANVYLWINRSFCRQLKDVCMLLRWYWIKSLCGPVMLVYENWSVDTFLWFLDDYYACWMHFNSRLLLQRTPFTLPWLGVWTSRQFSPACLVQHTCVITTQILTIWLSQFPDTIPYMEFQTHVKPLLPNLLYLSRMGNSSTVKSLKTRDCSPDYQHPCQEKIIMSLIWSWKGVHLFWNMFWNIIW